MPLSGDYEPSPSQWVRDQVETFERTGGAEGNTVNGAPIVVITSRGARSGKLRKNPVIRVEHGGAYLAVASKGGADDHPAWYRNMRAEPLVELQDGADRRDFVAREVEGEEYDAWWRRAVAAWPDYDAYREKTDRRIPLLVLEPAERA